MPHFIVRKFGKYYAVLVRGQEEEPKFYAEQIYRVWFPICSVFAVHGILEMNVQTEHIRMIDFEINPPKFVYLRRFMRRSMWFLGGVLCAFMVMYRQ